MKFARFTGVWLTFAAAAALAVGGVAGSTGTSAPTARPVPLSETFLNQSDLDIVERLPVEMPDARIRYDASPLTYGDLRLPAGKHSADYPVVVLIHGGAWESSYSAEYFGQLAEALTDAGVATWNLEFRRLNNPGSAYPGMFLDVAHGVDYVRILAEDYPIDPDNVVLMGHSSGGQLAAWASGRSNIDRTSELFIDDPLIPRGFVDLAGVLDLEYAFSAGRTDILQVVGAVDAAGLAAKAPTASPIEMLPLGVPQTLIIGSKDAPWRLESHDRYVDAGADAGDAIDLVVLDGANHFDVVDVCSPAWIPIVTAVFEYTGQPLKKQFTQWAPAACSF